MKCEFIDLNDKRILFDSILNSENRKLLAEDVINEIDRLENVIRNYEIQMEQVVNTYSNTASFKRTKQFRH